ncbi:Bug family tripartite tricarboxylate transporter substrate binding protein [Muricoccus vinaceus]|uniref:Bug family tripartite tricarboxylate transporter substrate binding protein n=1 Tax=Muricoccus vinaceus TaxID=424704 RepID=A0ABV6IR08_9PROT
MTRVTMTIPHRTRRLMPALAAVLAAGGIAVAPPAAAQEDWPRRPIRIIVPFAAGGTSDIMARLVSPLLSASLGQPLVVDNRSGAGGNIGAEACAKAPADGYTWCIGTISSHAINAAVYPRLPYDILRDFAPVALLGSQANALVVGVAAPEKSVADLVAAMRARPGGIAYGSPGIGTSAHLAGELLAQTIGAGAVHVPYRGSAQLLSDLLSGNLSVAFDNFAPLWPTAREGRVRVLGVGSPERLPQAPEVPTIAETLPGFVSLSWSGLFAPAGTPGTIVRRLNEEVLRVLNDPAVVRRYEELGLTFTPFDPAGFAAFVEDEVRKWGEVARRANIRAD